ncbi:TIGR00159 family protein, partial [Flavobacteriales bacterium]|nr:TIGR00159 family protein [Flavobacteriales bacterium]
MGFLDFNLLDLLDIFLVSTLLYQLFKLVRGTVAIKIFIGLALTYLFWKLVGALQMEVLSEILGQFIGVGVLAVIIVFQQEIRKFLLLIGTSSFTNKSEIFNFLPKPKSTTALNTKAIKKAFESMSDTKTGALLVITRNTELGSYE